jgi:hypothetical protein
MSEDLDAQSTPSKQPWKARNKDSKGTGKKFLGSVLDM